MLQAPPPYPFRILLPLSTEMTVRENDGLVASGMDFTPTRCCVLLCWLEGSACVGLCWATSGLLCLQARGGRVTLCRPVSMGGGVVGSNRTCCQYLYTQKVEWGREKVSYEVFS